MELRDSFAVRASAEEAWAFFWDLPRVARCLPGCERIEAAGDSAYRARMVQKVGPFQVAMDVDLGVDEVEPGRRIVFSGGGQDRMGNRLRISKLALELSAPAAERTEISYEFEFNLFGKLAALGNSVVKRKSEEARAEFSRNIAAELGGQNQR